MKTTRWVLVLVLIVLVIAACGKEDNNTSRDQVTVQLKWIHQAQFAGFYVAQEQGYYADENINVTFVEGGTGIDPSGQVIAGQAHFGVDSADRVLATRSQGQPIVAFASIFRLNPVVFVTMPDSGITRPTDFLGRKAAVGGGDAELQFRALMSWLDLDINQVEIVPYTSDYTAFYNGDIDVTQAYSTSGLIRMHQAGYDVNTIWPSDYGVHLYADMVVTTDQLIAENPDLVTRFLRATLKGWRTAVENSQTAVNDTLRYSADEYADMQTQMFDATIPLVHTGEDPIGWMQSGVWDGMYQMLMEQELLAEPFDVTTAYTMEFLINVYGDTP
jgi:NitT/TauT family transport system substrate-binding protein